MDDNQGPLSEDEKERFSKAWQRLADELAVDAGKRADGNPVLATAALAAAAGFTAGFMNLPVATLLKLVVAQHENGERLREAGGATPTQEDIAIVMAANKPRVQN